ncbi:MAG: hypothetical protein V4709_05830 [Pseudomonadota bacterium]
MKTTLLLRASLLTVAATLLPACGDVLDSPEDRLPPPVDLGMPSPAPTPAPTPAPAPAPAPTPAPAPAPTPSGLNGTPTKVQLAGTWLQVRNNGTPVTTKVTISFFTDNTYIEGGQENSSDCNPTPATAGTFANYDGNGNGVEFGQYDYNETNGRFQASQTVFFIDTNGDCGPHETTNAATQDPLTASFVNGVLRLADSATGSTFEFERVERGSGIVGSWYATEASSAGQGAMGFGPFPAIVSFFADGSYVLLTAEPQGSPTVNMDDDPGTQVGRYALDASGNLTVSNITADTSKGGFGAAQGNTSERLAVNSAGQLIYSASDGDGPFTISLTALPLPQRFDSTQLAGTYFNDEDGNGSIIGETIPFLAYFGSDGRFITGGLENDPFCVSDYSGTGVAVEPNGNGYEVGNYTMDATTGRLVVNISSETNGACGAYDLTKPEQRIYISSLNAGHVMAAAGDRDADDEPIILRRVPSTASSLFGAWRGTTNTAGTTPDDFLVAYFDDGTAGPASGTYLAVDANPGSTCSLTDPGPRGGIGQGSYLFDAGNSQIGYGFENDTMCQTRFDPNGAQTLSFTPDFLGYTDNQASTPPASFVYRKLSTP